MKISTKKLNILEHRGMRRSVVITGLNTDEKMAKSIELVEKFVAETLEIEANIVDMFKLGVGRDKPVVLTLESMRHKSNLFQAIQGYNKENEDSGIFVSDYLPAETNERRRREKEIFKDNEKNQTSKVQMTMDRSGLKIQGQYYEKKIQPPKATDILKCNKQQIGEVFNLSTPAGEWICEDENTYIAHKIETNTHEEISKAYLKMRMLYPQSKHIICAFVLPQLPKCYSEDFCDDDDIGCGRMVLNMLRKSKISSIAVFMIRLQAGKKIGNKKI